MKVLKGLLLFLLNLLLFFSISVIALAYMLNQTLMDPNFTAAEVDRLDIAAVVSSIIPEMNNPSGGQTLIDSKMLSAAIASSIRDAEPELKQDARTAIFSVYKYFLGQSDYFTVNISIEPVKNNLAKTLQADLKESPPAQIGGIPYSSLPAAQKDLMFNQFFDQISRGIPSSFAYDSTMLDPPTLQQVQQIRWFVSLYQTGWKILIALAIVLIALILLIEQDLRSSLRSLGINLFLFGAIGIAIDLLYKYLVPPSALSSFFPGVPAPLGTWLTQFTDDLARPLNNFSIAVAIIGAALFITSFFIRKKEEVKA